MLKVSKKSRGHPARTRSGSQEKERAKKVGGYVTRGSGNGWEKGDVRRRGVIRLECKVTTKKSFSITADMLEKIYDAALPNNEIPVIEVEFMNEHGKVYRTVAVVPSYIVQEIVEMRTDAPE